MLRCSPASSRKGMRDPFHPGEFPKGYRKVFGDSSREDANPSAIGSLLLVRETPDIGQVIISLRFLDLPIGI